MPCNECPETPDTGCLQPITTECVTYNGNDIDCADISSGQSLNQVIEQLADNDCDLQEQIEDIVQDIEELSGSVTILQEDLEELSGSVQTQIDNIPSFTCEDLSGCSIDDLLDVDVSPVSGDGLIFNGIKWVNYTPENIIPYEFTCEELSGCSVDDLNDVQITSPLSGDVLVYNTGKFKNYPLSSLINVEASNGLTELSGDVKLGGTLIENTQIDFDNSFDLTFNNLGRFGVFSGATTYAPKTFFHSGHTLTNPTPTLGYQTNILETNSSLSSYTLTNGKTLINSLFKNTFSIGSNITIQDGSQVSNTFNYQSFNATGSSRNFTIDQSSGLRVLANNKINTELSFTDFISTINHYANLEIINNVANGSNINTFTNFYQLLIRKSYGTGSLVATSSNLVNTYGIYQEGTADKNVFYGEIEYHGALTNASDLRSKNKGEAFTKGLDIIEQINPVNFTKKEGFGQINVNHVGIIAQEIEEILPEAIKIGKCQDIEDFRFYDQSVLLYTLLNAVKELSQKVNQLENAIK